MTMMTETKNEVAHVRSAGVCVCVCDGGMSEISRQPTSLEAYLKAVATTDPVVPVDTETSDVPRTLDCRAPTNGAASGAVEVDLTADTQVVGNDVQASDDAAGSPGGVRSVSRLRRAPDCGSFKLVTVHLCVVHASDVTSPTSERASVSGKKRILDADAPSTIATVEAASSPADGRKSRKTAAAAAARELNEAQMADLHNVR
jgi:hypothetical protein